MRPFVFINVAASVDGKISNERRERVRISCQEDLRRVDRLRAESDAVMVGIGTVISDNPRLTVKDPDLRRMRVMRGLEENPIRVVVDSRCRIPPNARILDGSARTIVAVSELADESRVRLIRDKAEVVRFGRERVDLRRLMEYLYDLGVRRVMVEGGARLNYGLLKERLVDEIYVYYGNMIIGGESSPTVVDGSSFDPPLGLELISVEKLGRGVLTKWRVKYG